MKSCRSTWSSGSRCAGDLADRLAAVASRGLHPVREETYDNGVRTVTFCDPDGNEIGFAGGPQPGRLG